MQRLLKKAAKGHEQSQNKLYHQFYGYGMGVALRYCSTREEAREVVHDAFIKVFSRLETYDFDQPFKPWLRKIVINAAIDHYRRYSRNQPQLEVVEADAVDLNESVLSSLTAEEILKAVSELTPKYRMVFTLYVVEGFKHEEIADKLGISIGTSKSNLSKARAKLQKQLESLYQEPRRSHG